MTAHTRSLSHHAERYLLRCEVEAKSADTLRAYPARRGRKAGPLFVALSRHRALQPGVALRTNGAREMPRDRLATLLEWHKEEPPDEWERHRNAEIEKVQGNRNPLIDQPDWGDKIAFSRGFAGN